MFGKALLVVLVAIFFYISFHFSVRLGLFRHHHKHYPGECRQVKGLEFGSEDLEITSDGLAFITSGYMSESVSDTFKEFIKANNVKGNIFLFDLNKPKSEAIKLKVQPSKNFNSDTFHPHGISLLEDKVKGEHLLYVINHADVERVDKFKFLPKTKELQHVRSFISDKFTVTNDLALIGEDKFYITNYAYFHNNGLQFVEQLLSLPLCTVVFFNGTDFVESLSGLAGPNGVFFSKDKRYLYMGMPILGGMSVYEVKKDNSLTLVQFVPLYTAVDNVHLSPSGDAVILGSHPIIFKVLKHLDDPRQRSPSMVLHAPLRDGKVLTEEVTEVFYDHGDLITASTVAAIHNNHMLIGSVIDKLVICSVDIKLE